MENEKEKKKRKDDRYQEIVVDKNIPIIDTEISEAERSILAMPPKFCMYAPLKQEDMELALEVMGAKVGYASKDWVKDGEEAEEVDDEEKEEIERVNRVADMESARSRAPYDHTLHELDLGRRRATDCKGNARVILPRAMTTKEESALMVKGQGLLSTFNAYVTWNCNKEGEQRTNLTKEQEEGLKSLRKRTKEREIVVMKTDKTDKLAVVSWEAYMKMGEVHLQGDREIMGEDVTRIQSITNGHTSSWIKILGIGEDWQHSSRVRETTMNKGDNVAPLYILLKDHKPVVEDELPKTRPVCSSQKGLNFHLQNILSDVIEPLAEEVEGSIEVGSTEDLLHEVDRLNDWWKKNMMEDDQDEVMLLGCDAVSLFPNLRKEESAAEVFREVMESKVSVLFQMFQ